ncbi:MAG: DUF488 domain-containing protein [Verrucomicrobia bacterium]|nr:MAG: DUF488 domain-containing protein [Verrucomicrobiota bacterium]
MNDLFTIGHSTLPWEEFLGLLRSYRVEVVADVRSSPYSGRLPQFNRELMERNLRLCQIRYVFLGAELGARRSEPECYVDGVARYDLIAQTPAFRAGLERLQSGIERFRTTLLCAEKDPLECHRTILVCRHLRNTATIQHIIGNGNLESHAQAEARLMDEERVPTEDLFASAEALLMAAYDKRGEKIAYREKEEVSAQA